MIFADLHICGNLDGARVKHSTQDGTVFLNVQQDGEAIGAVTLSGTPEELRRLLRRMEHQVAEADREVGRRMLQQVGP